jgi:hypothetical protein
MKTNVAFGLLLLASTTAIAAGCSTSNDDGDASSDESDYRKKPKGAENWASLTVQLPTGSCQPGGNCSRPLGIAATITLDGNAVTLGTANRVKPGDHVLGVNGASTKVALTAGATKTMTLPIARRKCQADNLPNLPQTDFGKSVALTNAACPSTAALDGLTAKPGITLFRYNWGCPAGYAVGTLSSASNSSQCPSLGTERVYSINVDGQCIDLRANRPDGQYGITPAEACNLYLANDVRWASSQITATSLADYDLAFVPGEYSYAVGTETRKFMLAEGSSSDIAIKLPAVGDVPATFATNLTFAEPRELADARATSITSSCGTDRAYAVAGGALTKLNLKAFQDTACVYTLTPGGGRAVELKQTAANTVTLKRFDVDDVEITRENGSTYTVKGTYEIYFGGALVSGPYPTNTGVNLLPGTYEVVTKFSTVDGPQTQRETLTF